MIVRTSRLSPGNELAVRLLIANNERKGYFVVLLCYLVRNGMSSNLILIDVKKFSESLMMFNLGLLFG